MINDLMNLEGVTVLDKKEQSAIKGGQRCKFTINGAVTELMSVPSSGEQGSAEANAYCVDLITSGAVDKCGYDCEHDGFGQ